MINQGEVRAGRDGCFRSLDIKERLHRGVAWVSLKATQRQKEFGVFLFVCLLFVFLGLYPQSMEVLRLGVQSEL